MDLGRRRRLRDRVLVGEVGGGAVEGLHLGLRRGQLLLGGGEALLKVRDDLRRLLALVHLQARVQVQGGSLLV